MDPPVVETLGTTHIDNSGVYTSTENEILLIVQATNTLVISDERLASLHASAYYCHTTAVFDELHAHYLKQSEEKFAIFPLFHMEIQQTKKITMK